MSQTNSQRQLYELTVPDTPPSLNSFGSVGGGTPWPYIKAKKKWEGMLAVCLMQAQVPRGLIRVEASATLTFRSKRKRDEGNFRFLLEKALGDVLTSGGWLPDDDADRYSFAGLAFSEERGDPATVVRLEVEA